MTGDTGKIRFRRRASQQIDYSGLRYKTNATPSNIDGVLELDDHLFVLLEYKHIDAQPMSTGQRMLIERMTDALWANGRYSIAIVGHHNRPVHEDIDAANSIAFELRWGGANGRA